MNLFVLAWIVVFILSYFLILFSADKLLDTLESVMESTHFTPVTVGIMFLGTDLEEATVSISAAGLHYPYLALGNIIGNSILAIGIAFGIPLLYLHMQFKQIPKHYYAILYLASTNLLLSILLPSLLWSFSIIGLLLFISYILMTILNQTQVNATFIKQDTCTNDLDQLSDPSRVNRKQKPSVNPKVNKARTALLSLFFFALLLTGGNLIITSAEALISLTELRESFFGLVIMAFVTNAEEFQLMIQSIKKNQVQLGVSTQIGKLLWNTTLVFGISGLLLRTYTFNATLLYSSILLVFLLTLLIYFLLRKALTRLTGSLLLFFVLFFLFMNFYELLT